MLRAAADGAHDLTTNGKVMLAGASVTTGAGIWDWLGTNHSEITAACAIIGAVCTVGGFIVTLVRKPKQ